MDDDPIHILIVEDEEAHSALIRHAYKKRGDNVKITIVENLRKAKKFLETTIPAVVIADWLLPDGRGSDLLTKEPDKLPYPVVVITSHGDELMAVDIIKAGAIDFIMKSDLTLSEMPNLVDRALHQWRKVLEHRQAQVALRENEERLRVLFEYAPDGIVLTNTEGTVVDINRAALRIAGLTKDHVVGKKFYELGVIDPEQISGVIEMMKTSPAAIRSEPLLFRARTHDGAWRTLETRSFPINDRTGILSMTILRDITERQRAEQALAEERNLLRALIDSVPHPLYAKDIESRFIVGNASVVQRFGFENADKLIGKNDADLYTQNLAEKFRREEIQVMRSGEPILNRETSEVKPDSSTKWFLNSKVPLRDANGDIIGLIGILNDITERKLAEQELALERNQLRTLIDNIPDAAYFKDLEGRFVIANKAVARLLGAQDPASIVGKIDHDFYPRQVADAYLAEEKAILETGRPMINKEGSFIVDGQIGWSISTKVPLTDLNGKIVGIVGITRDITERKLAEQELAIERNQLRTLIDNIPDGVWFKDTESRFVIANKAVAWLLGADDPASATGKTDRDFHPPEEADCYIAEEKLIYQTGRPMINKEGSFTVDGQYKWSLTTKVPLRNPDGRIIGIVGIARDITERKLAAQKLQQAYDELEDRVKERTAQLSETNRDLQVEISERKLAEEALRQSQKRQKALLDTIPDVAWLKDREGRFIAVNEPLAETCGLKPEELIGKTDFDIWPEELAKKYRRDDAEVIRTGVRKWVEEPFVDRTKKRSWVETIKSPIYNNSGQIVGTSAIARDVTQRKKMERKLRESEKLAVAGRLAAKVAHEINNPLAGIKNSFLLIKDAIPPDHPYYDYVARIDKEISRVTCIVRRMFDLYRPETQSSQVFCVSDVINDVVALLNVTIKQTEVAIKVDVADNTAAVNLPEGMFRQVLFNVVANAVEASPPGRTVTLAAALADHSLNIAVTDSGHGIPEEIQDSVFEPFFTTKTGSAASGLGLGLAVCKSEVEAMGGSITFESKPGSGTRFEIRIPTDNHTEKKYD